MQIPPLARVAAIVGVLTVVVWLVVRARLHDERFFSYGARSLAGDAYGANCVWRAAHWPQAGAAIWCLTTGWDAHSTPWWTAGLTLTVLAGTGLPITRRVGRCGGCVQGGHQWPAAHGGTTSIWNIEPICMAHNVAQSARWSWTWAARQWGPWTLLVYGVRNLSGTVRLAMLLARDHRAREAAR